MATGAGADGFFRPIYEGCISGYDHCVERRPYHRNCGCALHSKSKKSKSSRNKTTTCTHKLPGCNNVSYPMRRAWSEGSLSLSASPNSSPSTSPAPPAGVTRPQLGSVLHDEEEEYHNTKISGLFEF